MADTTTLSPMEAISSSQVLPIFSSPTGIITQFTGRPSAKALLAQQMAKLSTLVEDAVNFTHRAQNGSSWKRLSSPLTFSYDMFLTMTGWMKRLYSPPLHFVASFVPLDRIRSLSQRTAEIIEKLKGSLMQTVGKGGRDLSGNVDQLVNQLSLLSENVSNLQSANEDLKGHQKALLDDIGNMRSYLELLNRQLQEEEMERLEMIQENGHLRQSLLSYQEKNDMTLFRGHGDKEICRSRMLPGLPVQSSSLRLFNDSSADGSTQGSMDKNPPATIETSIDEFQLSISYLYQGNVNVAWLRPPKVGDYIEFKFHEPTLLKRFKVGSGHYEYPNNKLSHATIEILPSSSNVIQEKTRTAMAVDNYRVVGRFDHSGLAEGDIDWQNVGPVERLRVNIHSGCVNWIVMTELSLEIVYIENEMTLPSPVEVNEEEYESW